MSLLDRAKGMGRRKKTVVPPSGDELELALAFIGDEVRYAQVASVLKCSSQNVPSWAFSVLKRAVASGAVAIVVKEPRS